MAFQKRTAKKQYNRKIEVLTLGFSVGDKNMLLNQ
jgi:hypothetical protein